MGKNYFLLLIFLLITFLISANAHEGWGSQFDSKGNFYFTNIGNRAIWKYTADNNLQKLYSDKWVHQLFVDENDNLYLENEEFEMGNGWVSLIKITPNGEESYIIGPTNNDELMDSKFALDKQGNLYYQHISTIDDDVYVYIYKREPDGEYYPFIGGLRGVNDGYRLEASFTKIESMTLLRDGNIYVSDNGAIRKISLDGQVTTIAKNLLLDNPPANPWGGNRFNSIYDIVMDAEGNFYVAYYSNAQVLKIAPNGNRSEFYHTGKEWFPLGVAYRNGDLYVFATGHGSQRGVEQFQVVKVSPSGTPIVLIESGRIISRVQHKNNQTFGYRLEPNYPNPFNNSTVISFTLPTTQHVTLDIYTVTGQHITNIIHDTIKAGNHSVKWDGTNNRYHVPNGIYFARISTDLFIDSQKILHIK